MLVGWDALLVHDLCLEVLDGVGGLSLDGDGLAGKRLDKDLHDVIVAVGVLCVGDSCALVLL